ncbi:MULTISPECIES: tryptophan synthase subunit alpha [unclassified Exiguobacterium]|uniref:tryptophan synthase subunit alpha n=1 Tax=unclassified Exiguobacterium TaxID=2644629 RepID=UPI0022AEE581|nr:MULTISPECIES: tryptophan synthase subunit alpha [unclassified Exiguobacterium]MDT0192709.1 tryptophan synthase subunit alpha [Exiguobacterium sp. BG5(2022)]
MKLETAIRQREGAAFVPYIMAGDGGMDRLIPTIVGLERMGATAIELGIPFSDPVADGPIIEAAGMRALKAGVTLEMVLNHLIEGKDQFNVPIVLMTYLNPVFRFGVQPFFDQANECGVSGVIIPDLPFEESLQLFADVNRHDVAVIPLVTLTSSEARTTSILEKAEGFVYAVTLKGTTGKADVFPDELLAYLTRLTEQSRVPVLAGFGVHRPEQVQTLGQACDGVVVGSFIVEALHEGRTEDVETLIQSAKHLHV